MEMLVQKKKLKRVAMPAPVTVVAEPITALEPSDISCRTTAALALAVVRDGVITGEGPTTRGRVHFHANSMPMTPPGARAS
jgi:hypothetical protein